MTGGAIAADLRERLDEQPLRAMHVRVTLLCLLAMLIDGYDLFMLGLALPVMARDLGVPANELVGIVVAQNVGLAIGAASAGPVADRYGRKWPLIASVVAFGLLTIATTASRDLATITVLRFLSGLFFAGVIPNAVALTNETAPARLRTGLTALIFCGYTGGTAIGSAVNGSILATSGWQLAFQIGGALGLLVAVPLALFLPESLPFLVRRNAHDPRAARLAQRLIPGLKLAPGEALSLGEHSGEQRRSGLSELFASGQRRATLLLWLLFVLSFICNTTLAGWSATVLVTLASVPIEQAGTMIGSFALAGLVATAVAGFVMGRVGASRTLIGFYGIAIVALLAIAANTNGHSTLFALMAVAGFGFAGGQAALNAFVADAYPTRIRATGVGWAFGSGRLGAIVGPWLGGIAIAGGIGAPAFFAATTLPLFVIAILVPATVAAVRRSRSLSSLAGL